MSEWRQGKTDYNRPRPRLLFDTSMKYNIINNTRNLRTKTYKGRYIYRISFLPDMTRRKRELDKKPREELKPYEK